MDLWTYNRKLSGRNASQISNERDFESITYFHLRSFLKQFPEIKISTNYSLMGLDVWKQEKGKWKRVNFVMPDIVISERSSNEKKPLNHLIAFELKTESPGNGNAPNFNSEKYELDFRKLNRLMRANKIKRAYYLLVYSDPEKSEKVVVENIKECWFSRGKATSKDKARRTKQKKFKSFVFNRYVNPRTKKIVGSERKRAEIQYKGMKYFRSYYNNTEPINRKKTLERLEDVMSNQGSRNVGAGAKAWITRKRNKIAKKLFRRKYEKLNKTQKKRVEKIRKRG